MTYSTINPATGETLQTFDDISDAALDEAMNLAHACYETDWSHRTIAERSRIMHAAAEYMRRNKDHLAALATLEMGKLIAESEGEVLLSADILDYYAKNAESFLQPRPIPGDPADSATTLGPLASENGLKGLLKQIEIARKGGATILLGGNRIDRPGFYLEPTIISDITRDNPVYQLELFGPALCFYVVETEDEAIELANATPFGLGASVFTADIERGKALARRIESGMVFLNQPVWSAPELPFGGVKNSGYGRELSELGIGEFVNHKLIYVSAAGTPAPTQGG